MFAHTRLSTVASLLALALGAATPALAQQTRQPPPRHEQRQPLVDEGNCAAQMNFLPRIVRKEQIEAVPPDANVLIHSICEGESMTDFGNVGALDKTIEANAALGGALSAHGLRGSDVVGINIHTNDNGVDLYVHP
jgi:hypothetical protein